MDFTSVNIKKIKAMYKKLHSEHQHLYNTINILLIQTKKAFNISVKITLKNIIRCSSVPNFYWKSKEETPNSHLGLLKFHFLSAYPRRMIAEWTSSKNSEKEIKNTAEGKTI